MFRLTAARLWAYALRRRRGGVRKHPRRAARSFNRQGDFTPPRPHCQHFFQFFLIFFSTHCKPFQAALRGQAGYLSGNALKRRTSPHNAPKWRSVPSRAHAHAPARYSYFAHTRARARARTPRQRPAPRTPPGECIGGCLSIARGGAVSERTGEGRGLIALPTIYIIRGKTNIYCA